MSHGCPPKCVIIKSLVFLDILSLKSSIFILPTSSHPQNFRLLVNFKTGVHVAWKVKLGAITSSPFLIPNAEKAECKADVPELVAKAYFVPINLAKAFSNFSTINGNPLLFNLSYFKQSVTALTLFLSYLGGHK